MGVAQARLVDFDADVRYQNPLPIGRVAAFEGMKIVLSAYEDGRWPFSVCPTKMVASSLVLGSMSDSGLASAKVPTVNSFAESIERPTSWSAETGR